MARPRKFNEADVLACAMTEFWRHGYAATTMRSLESSSGVGVRSLANTFGDKDQLFVKALAHYRNMAAQTLDGALSPPSVDGLIAVFQGLSAPAPPEAPMNQGCLMVNSVFELDEPSAAVAAEIDAYRSMWLEAFRTALEADGVADAPSKSEFLLSSLWGALSQIRLAGATTAAEPTTRVVVDMLHSWKAAA